MSTVNWTDDKIASLKKMWLAGEAMDEIRRKLGRPGRPISHGAVSGKVFRLGLPKRTGEALAAQHVHSGKRAAGTLPTIQVKPTKIDFTPKDSDVVRIHTTEALTSYHCRWPIGDPRSPGFGYCGAKCSEIFGYCTEHATRAYNPTAPIKHDKRLA